jgi:hypothetical protein
VFYWETGIPGFVTPGQPREIILRVEPLGGESIDVDSVSLNVRQEGGSWSPVDLTSLGDNRFSGDLPAIECVERIEFYAAASGTSGTHYADPSAAPTSGYTAIAADGQETLMRDDMEDDTTGWAVINDSGLTTGAWERVDPIGTLFGSTPSQPEDDATAGADAIRCWITQNGTVGGSVGEADVDGGQTTVVSPVLDLSVGDGTISYMRWMFDSEGGDVLQTFVSNDDGGTWTFVHDTGDTSGEWELATFVVSEYTEPTALVRVAWAVADANTASVVEAGIDNLQVDTFVCDKAEPCPGDINDDGTIGVEDILLMLGAWGDAPGDPADLNGDGFVDVDDLLILLGGFGDC